MNPNPPRRSWLARSLPGLLLAVTIVDDLLFGGAIVAARLAFGTTGLVVASMAFVLCSVAMAAGTAWALRREPLRLSSRNRQRVAALQDKRLGRFLIPHPERPLTTVVAAVIFGSVAPMIVASLDARHGSTYTGTMTFVAGIVYGLVFAAGYGLLGAVIGTAA